MSGLFGGNGRGPKHGDEPENPVFRRLRALLFWHRAVLLVAAFTAGRWAALVAGGLLFGTVPEAALLLAALEIAAVVALWAGLSGFVRLAPWSIPLLLVVLVACSLPISRETGIAGAASLGGDRLAVAVPLIRLDAPDLGGVSLPLGIDPVPAVFAVWLWFLRPLHRRVAKDAPLGAQALRPRKATWLASVGLFCLTAVPMGAYLADLDPVVGVDAVTAQERVAARLAGRGLRELRCTRSSDALSGPLFRPFYFVVFVAEHPSRPADGARVAIAGARRVDAATGAVRDIGIADATPAPGAPRDAETLCRGIDVDVSVRTETRVPFPLSLL